MQTGVKGRIRHMIEDFGAQGAPTENLEALDFAVLESLFP